MVRRYLGTFLAAVAVTMAIPVSVGRADWHQPVSSRQVNALEADGERLLFTDKESKELMLLDLRSGTEWLIAKDVMPYQIELSGPYAAYEQAPEGGPQSLYLQHFGTGETRKVVEGATGWPVLRGNRLVYGRWDSEGLAWHLYDLTTKSSRELARVPGNASAYEAPAFDGKILAWSEGYNTSSLESLYTTLVALNVETGERKTASFHALAQVTGAAEGRIVYTYARKGQRAEATNDEVRVWDLASNGHWFVAGREGIRQENNRPTIRGSLVAWPASDGTYVHDLNTVKRRQVSTAGGTDLRLTDRHAVYVTGDRISAVHLDPAQKKPEPTEPAFYAVAPGDTMWLIAQKHGVSFAELVRSNNWLNPDVIKVGEQLYLPPPVSPQKEFYTVKPGDTLAKIAVQYKTTVYNLAMTNQLNRADYVEAGKTLQVSRGPEGVAEGTRVWQTYAVMPGDTLWSIAQRAGVTVQHLLEVNQFHEPVQPSAGQMLIIRK